MLCVVLRIYFIFVDYIDVGYNLFMHKIYILSHDSTNWELFRNPIDFLTCARAFFILSSCSWIKRNATRSKCKSYEMSCLFFSCARLQALKRGRLINALTPHWWVSTRRYILKNVYHALLLSVSRWRKSWHRWAPRCHYNTQSSGTKSQPP